MAEIITQFHTDTETDTAALAATLAPVLKAGDTLLLSGQIGAGKTTLARALIRCWLGDPMAEVPSPTFTLVQTYERGPVEMWHCDLYRLTDPEELSELGLHDALPNAIALVEWPDQVVTHWPPGSLRIELSAGRDGHALCFRGDAAWQKRLAAAGCLADQS